MIPYLHRYTHTKIYLSEIMLFFSLIMMQNDTSKNSLTLVKIPKEFEVSISKTIQTITKMIFTRSWNTSLWWGSICYQSSLGKCFSAEKNMDTIKNQYCHSVSGYRITGYFYCCEILRIWGKKHKISIFMSFIFTYSEWS